MMNRSRRQQFNAFNRLIDQLQSAAKQSVSSSAHKSCMWVPAALHEEEIATDAYSLSYGGVLIAPTVREGFVSRSGIAKAQTVPINKSKLLSAPSRHVQSQKIPAAGDRSSVNRSNGSSRWSKSGGRPVGTSGKSSTTSGPRGGSNYQEGAQTRRLYQRHTIPSTATSMSTLLVASRNQNTTPLRGVCKDVFSRTLSLVAPRGNILQMNAEERVGRRFLDVTITTTEGMTIVEYKTTGKSAISPSGYIKHIRQILNYRREYMVKHGVEPKSSSLPAQWRKVVNPKSCIILLGLKRYP